MGVQPPCPQDTRPRSGNGPRRLGRPMQAARGRRHEASLGCPSPLVGPGKSPLSTRRRFGLKPNAIQEAELQSPYVWRCSKCDAVTKKSAGRGRASACNGSILLSLTQNFGIEPGKRIANIHVNGIVVRTFATGLACGKVPQTTRRVFILPDQVDRTVLSALPHGLIEAKSTFLDRAVLGIGRARRSHNQREQELSCGVERHIPFDR